MNSRVRIYVVSVALLAAVSLLAASWSLSASDPSAHWNALVAFAALAFVSEASYLRLRVGRSETQSSVVFIPFIASVLLFDTGWAALAAGAAFLAAEFAIKRKAPIKIVFNVSQQALSVAVASWVYRGLGGTPSLEVFTLSVWATLAAVAAYFFVNSTAVSLAVALSDGAPFRAAWLRIAGVSLVYDFATSPLAPLLSFLYIKLQLLGIVIVIVPLYLVRHMYHLFLQLEQVNRDLLELMVKAIEARDPYTSGHSQRVSQLAGALAREIGLGHKLVEQIRTAALLHDVGKIHEEYAPLLRKGTKLEPAEKALMQTHSTRSAELVGTISGFRGVIEQAVKHHHENFDGTGYPHGLTGESIPIGARIIMIADTIDAMTTDRPYRTALSFERVIMELRKFAGRQFDPALVEVVIKSPSLRSFVAQRTGEPLLSIGPSFARTSWRESSSGTMAETRSSPGR